MALPLPDLDDRSFGDLMDEARSLIQTYDPAWTNYNPSDPGITLIELFAWLAELLIYQLNRIPDRHLVTFLKLLNGPSWHPSSDPEEDVRSTITAMRHRRRAVTDEDYEALAREASPEVARAKCVPRRYLDAGTEEERVADRPGHVSVIIVPRTTTPGPQPSGELRESVWAFLDSRRVLTTRHHIVGPVYAPVRTEILVARRADASEKAVRDQVVSGLTAFFDALTGGTRGEGWPFGRDVYVSELYELLEGVAGVDYVPDIALFSECPRGATRYVPAPQMWTPLGDLVGLDLAAHHLPVADIDPGSITISSVFVQLSVALDVSLTEGTAEDNACRKVKTAVKRLFHPLHGGPDGTSPEDVRVQEIGSIVRSLPEISTVNRVELAADSNHLLRDASGNITGVRIGDERLIEQYGLRELADVQVSITIS